MGSGSKEGGVWGPQVFKSSVFDHLLNKYCLLSVKFLLGKVLDLYGCKDTMPMFKKFIKEENTQIKCGSCYNRYAQVPIALKEST